MGAAVQAMTDGNDAMLLGRRTYEEFAAYWPTSTDDFAEHMNGTRKYVASNSLTTADWENSTLVTGDVAAELTQLKAEPGGNLGVTGSGTRVRSLLRDGLPVHPCHTLRRRHSSRDRRVSAHRMFLSGSDSLT
jgi:dihydrofolate reductase